MREVWGEGGDFSPAEAMIQKFMHASVEKPLQTFNIQSTIKLAPVVEIFPSEIAKEVFEELVVKLHI